MTGRHRLVIGAELDAFDEDTGALETFELRTPTLAHTVPGYGSLREPSPSRRVAAAPVPEAESVAEHRAARPPVDWVTWIRRVLVLVAAVVTVYGMWRLARAVSADGLLFAAQLVSGGWLTLGGLAGWGLWPRA